MKLRTFAGAVIGSLVLGATAGAAGGPMTMYPVPRGGFALELPPTWIDLTSTTPAPNASGKTPTMATIAEAASRDGTRKLVVADPKGGGKVYIDIEVERVGTVGLAEAATATAAAIKKDIGKSGKVSSTRVALGAGPAYRLHYTYTQQKVGFETDEYLVITNQLEYLMLYVAPKASWSKYSAMFDASAQSFRVLAGPRFKGVVLSNDQVGTGYKGSVIPGGDSFIGEVTLDLCAGAYPSESLRTGRIQMRYIHTGKTVPVSNEVVSYVTGGAQEALREVRSVAQSCAQKPVVLKSGTLKNVLTVTPIKDSKLLPGAVAVQITVQETNGSKHKTTTGIAVYQVKNNTLSGVYAWTAKGTTLKQTEQLGLHAAEQSARNLGGLSLSA